MDQFIIETLRYGTPLVYVTMAGMLASRSGIWHLGLEGLMIIGCCASVLGVVETDSITIGLGLAIVLCVIGSALLWFVIEKLRANPIIAGLGLTGLGLGGTDLAVQSIYGSQASVNAPFGLPRLGAAFGPYGVLSVLVVLMPIVVFALWLLLRRTRFGLQLAASGEHPFAARSVGARPPRLRLMALCLGGVLCGLGGAELALGSLQIFAYGMTPAAASWASRRSSSAPPIRSARPPPRSSSPSSARSASAPSLRSATASRTISCSPSPISRPWPAYGSAAASAAAPSPRSPSANSATIEARNKRRGAAKPRPRD